MYVDDKNKIEINESLQSLFISELKSVVKTILLKIESIK